MSKKYTEHHPFCNFFNTPIETCKQCKGLYEKYGDRLISDIMEKDFPEVVERL